MKKYFMTLILMICFCGRVYAYDSYKIGEKVFYNNENWYVIKDSSEEENYVTLLKGDSLTGAEITKYGGQTSEVPYDPDEPDYIYDTSLIDFDDCSYINNVSYFTPGEDCSNEYDTSLVKKVIDNWLNDSINIDDLIEIEGSKVRLLTLDDLTNNLGYELMESPYGFTSDNYQLTDNKLSKFLYFKSSNLPFWLGTKSTNLINGVYVLDTNKISDVHQVVMSKAKVRPVINLKKEALENIDNSGITEVNENRNNKVCRTEKRMIPIFPEYKIGDVVTYNDQQYLVIDNSSTKKEYVTLLKIDPLTSEEIGRYYDGPISIDDSVGVVEYSSVNGYWYYNTSNVKTIVDAWIEDKGFEDLIITNDDIDSPGYIYPDSYDLNSALSSFGYSKYNGPQTMCEAGGSCWTVPGDPYDPTLPTPSWFNESVVQYIHSSTTPSWLYDSGYDYWLYSGSDVTRNSHYIMGRNGDVGLVGKQYEDGWIEGDYGTKYAAVRPTINVFILEAFGGPRAFTAGETVTYNGIDFYVLEDSPIDDQVVKLLKKTPLTQGEINKYSNISSTPHSANDIQYKSGCSYYGSCAYGYNDSDVKKVVDNWADENLDLSKLVEVNGYKVRIIDYNDLVENLGYDAHTVNTFTHLEKSDDTPVEVYQSGEIFWAMNIFEDSYSKVYAYNDQANPSSIDSYYKVRPVINLYKCELGGCEYEEKEVEVCEPELVNPIVEVGNTLFSPSGLVLLLSVILITGGLIIFVKIQTNKKI